MASVNVINAFFKMKETSENMEAVGTIKGIAVGKLEEAQDNARLALRRLGKSKCACFSNTIPRIHSLFDKLNIDYKSGDPKHRKINFRKIQISNNLNNICIDARKIVEGSAASIGGGALVAFGAYSAVGMFGSASTGTAIAALGGQAAINATLAWLGGGSIAAGGYGMAGGTLALGGIAAVPAVLILGVVINAQADKALYDSKKHIVDAVEFSKTVELVTIRTTQLIRVAKLANKVLLKLEDLSVKVLDVLDKIQLSEINDFDSCNESDKESLYRLYTLYELIDSYCKINIFNDKGELVDGVENDFVDLENQINN